MKSHRCFSISCIAAAALSLAPISIANAATSGKTFTSPEDAVRALKTAVNSHDTNALAAIFGPGFADIVSPDPVQAENELAHFGDDLNRSNRLDRAAQDRCILETGEDQWPFPIPIVRVSNNAWHFDTEAGKDEIINRRIGRNELDALKSVRAYADAQREYASKDRDGDEVLEYAQKLVSPSGTKEGLYWPEDQQGELSPLGPAFVEAQSEGYFKEAPKQDGPRPFHGYYFRILTQQGKHAPGGAYDYIINGNMIGGFALVAWPAEYGESGVMTFIINQQGKVYQKDLGPGTGSIVKDMKAYDPDPSWARSRE
jgi:Protein of unknown function (DUF2950)